MLNREQREKDGFWFFRAWINRHSHVHIGPNIHKYWGAVMVWITPYLAHFPRKVSNAMFVKYVRSNEELMKKSPYLKNKILAAGVMEKCWLSFTMKLCRKTNCVYDKLLCKTKDVFTYQNVVRWCGLGKTLHSYWGAILWFFFSLNLDFMAKMKMHSL